MTSTQSITMSLLAITISLSNVGYWGYRVIKQNMEEKGRSKQIVQNDIYHQRKNICFPHIQSLSKVISLQKTFEESKPLTKFAIFDTISVEKN